MHLLSFLRVLICQVHQVRSSILENKQNLASSGVWLQFDFVETVKKFTLKKKVESKSWDMTIYIGSDLIDS